MAKRPGYYKEYYAKNRERVKAKVKAYRLKYALHIRDKDKARRKQDKLDALAHYGGVFCSCCGEARLGFLTLDHINQDGAQQRTRTGGTGSHFYYWLKRNNYPDLPLQVQCYNCNCGRFRNGGVCPHKET